METKLNIAEILKDKPQGTKLYDLLCNMSVKLNTISTTETIVWCSNKTDNKTTRLCCYSEFGTVRGCPDGLQILKPSKSMQDWSKFAWKKGDILIMDGCRVVFDKWLNDDYTRFNAVHLITYSGGYFDKPLQNRYSPISNFITKYWRKTTDAEAKIYMDFLERECDGKLNLETLEIERKPEFKDGDILSSDEDTYTKHTILIFHKDGDIKESIVSLVRHSELVEDNEPIDDFFLSRLYYAREDEKKELFDALAKENKAWDAEKKQIVNLKPRWTPKPFDRVITKVDDDAIWTANIFSHIDQYGEYVTIGCESGYSYCLPYNEETAKLIGTTKDVED